MPSPPFPVMAAAIGVPILIHADGGNPAVIGAVGMLAGFCGTLMTPMAANFNIVPAALLELKNQYGVIKAQIATAIPLLIANILILYFAGFTLSSSTPELASRMAGSRSAMSPKNIRTSSTMCFSGDADALTPRVLHPIFFGSFDWHSCVHGWWTLLTLRRLFPDIPEARPIYGLADESFTRGQSRWGTSLSRPRRQSRI